jgi:uncharacterized metal-binding protein YceD (DUF177 family)
MLGAAHVNCTPNLESSSRRYFEVDARISSGGDFKNKDLHRIRFDRAGTRPYYTRPMAAGLPDRVDCERLAADEAVLHRVYELRELPRLQDLLAEDLDAELTGPARKRAGRDAAPSGAVHARFVFECVGAGRAGATVRVQARPALVCQRCLQGFPFAVDGESAIEFAGSEDATPVESQREIYVMDRGQINLRDLVEEELLLAIPAVAACPSPETCGRAPAVEEERSRPLAALRDILKKT